MSDNSRTQAAPPRRRRWWRLLLAAAAAWWLAGIVGAFLVARGRTTPVAAARELAGRPVEAVSVTTRDGLTVRGWLVRAHPDSRDCVVLAAGIRGNRTAMQSRAEWYLARGWSALLVDLRGTGESDAASVSFGWHEAKDLQAWHESLRGLGFLRIGAHGQSLGAAAIVYCEAAWAFTVLESCYADVDEALQARLPWIPLPQVSLWPLRCCTEWLLGIDADALRPVECIARRSCPTLFLCGEHDAEVGPAGASRMLAACEATDKRLVWIRGAGHVDLLAADATALSTALAAFVPAPAR